MSFAVVNSAHLAPGGSPTTFTIPSTTVNNLGIFAVSLDAASAGIAAVPTGWTRIGTKQHDTTSLQDATCFYKVLAAAETAISWTGGWDAVGFAYVELSGTAASTPLDVQDTAAAFASSSSGVAFSSSNITPAGANELIVAVAYDQGGAPTFSAGAGFTLATAEPGVAGTTGGAAIEWKTGASGLQNATFTVDKTGDSVTVQIAAFLALGGGGGGGGSNAPEKLRVVQSSQRW